MRHWAWALSARLTSRGDRSLFETMSANLRMNRQCRAAAWRARISAMAAAGSGSLSGGSGMDSPHAGGTIYSPIPIAIGILGAASATTSNFPGFPDASWPMERTLAAIDRDANHLCRSRRWSGTAKNRATFCRSRSVQIRTPQAGSMARRAESLRPISATSPTRQAPSSKRERAPKVRLATALKTTETAMAKT